MGLGAPDRSIYPRREIAIPATAIEVFSQIATATSTPVTTVQNGSELDVVRRRVGSPSRLLRTDSVLEQRRDVTADT